MEHSINYNKSLVASLEDVKIYVKSYEMTRDRKLSFMNRSNGGFYLTDNGTYPAYLKIKGTILRSECEKPCVVFDGFANRNTQFFLNLDGVYFNAARLKSYQLTTETGNDMVECEVVLCCQNVSET